jgi:hypothetical protein
MGLGEGERSNMAASVIKKTCHPVLFQLHAYVGDNVSQQKQTTTKKNNKNVGMYLEKCRVCHTAMFSCCLFGQACS